MWFNQNFSVKSKDPFKLTIRNQGLLNKNKVIYYIHEDNENLGFFAMYRYWVEYLYFADICGYDAVIDADKGFAYCENHKLNGKSNGFEYYFCQPANIKAWEAKLSNKVIYSNVIHREMVELIYTGKFNHYYYNRKYLYAMSRVVKKHMKFNENTRDYILSGCQRLELFDKKVIGVHIRGTDFKSQYNNHPICLREEDYYDIIESIWKKGTYDKIFLATDDSRILKKILNKYGDKICYYSDVTRNNRNRSVVFEASDKEDQKYLLGLEVLRDMYSLAVCQGLVAGISQVAICAQINKLAMGKQYEDLIIINKGINKNTRKFRK